MKEENVMANLLAERIKNTELTKKQRIIGDYFIKNQERIGNLSALDIANEIGVSDASIIRFSKAIGFEGYADLKNKIYDMLVENSSNKIPLTERMRINYEKLKDGDVTEQFIQKIQDNISDVFSHNSLEDFETIANAMVNGKRRYVIGLRGCKGTAIGFGRLLSFMMPNVTEIIDSECTSISLIQDLEEGDVVLMFVFSRFYKIDLEYLKYAKKNGAQIYLVINDVASILSSYADDILIVPTDSMNFCHSTTALNVITEYLLTLISRKCEFKERIDTRDQITEDQRL